MAWVTLICSQLGSDKARATVIPTRALHAARPVTHKTITTIFCLVSEPARPFGKGSGAETRDCLQYSGHQVGRTADETPSIPVEPHIASTSSL